MYFTFTYVNLMYECDLHLFNLIIAYLISLISLYIYLLAFSCLNLHILIHLFSYYLPIY